jgi:hypothetical protein
MTIILTQFQLACISTPMTAFLGYPFVYSETPIGGRAAIAAFTG